MLIQCGKVEPSTKSNYLQVGKWNKLLWENSLDAGIQDESTSISIEVRKMMKSTKFEERCEDGDESDKHI